ncbi:EamA family transporter [Rathayibacter sp. VKM Ac-2801]|uniref:EamA family transporter n=1 Tax=Rathayibacter sp. VKM Ac-2801 TaxID=2609255 RepID=UPI00131F7CC5|nr:EamA family transporter [Rathayibacter sp. VKM Ac-2801]QHC71518.1 EamA family transporter [Rathayibacter sp. VKM Ac-2801]
MTKQLPGDGRTVGVATALASALSNQLGAASGTLAFPALGSVGVVAVRQIVAALILLPVVRPRIRDLTRAQWWPVLLLAVVFGAMNLALYAAIDRIGLGLAVTLEFCGPLAVALLGSRSRTSALCALVAGAGVVAIAGPRPSSDQLGISLGLAAACCWAAYILLNRIIGLRLPGAQGTATATGFSAAVFLPVAVGTLATTRPDAATVLLAVGAGVLATAVPFVADVIALRRLPTSVFGMLMSVNPVLAALIGAVVLGQDVGAAGWIGIALIVTANAAVLRRGRRAR